MTKHTQCNLHRGDERYTAWVPSNIAIKGRTVKLKNEDGTWDENWIVNEVFTTLPSKIVNERSQDYKKTRKASDI